MFGITPSARLRPSPFDEATLAAGVTAFTTYNHMLMPTSYGSPEKEYWRLLRGVSQWDVACERQVELKGRDAGRLAQILSPRDLRRCEVGAARPEPRDQSAARARRMSAKFTTGVCICRITVCQRSALPVHSLSMTSVEACQP